MINFLQEYIRINTAHPKPDYGAAIAFLKKHSQQDGFKTKRVELPSGNTALVITFLGSNAKLPALALNHHIDVVPAKNIEQWKTHPFSGTIINDVLIGRGTQDMKGVGAVHYAALKQLKDSGVTPHRTIHIIAVPDEECGGFKGTKEFVKTESFKQLNIGFLLDEGRPSGNTKQLLIKVDERKPIQVKITTQGTLAHGSRLRCHNAIHELIDVLQHITVLHKEQQAKTEPDGLLLSLNITSITAGVITDGVVALNVVPNCAQATIDIRVPPTMQLAEVQKQFETIITNGSNTNYTIEATVKERTPVTLKKNQLYNFLEQAVQSVGLHAEPFYSEGSSDMRFYREKGIKSFGFTPFTCTENLHGTNESVPVSNLEKGKEIVYHVLQNLCT